MYKVRVYHSGYICDTGCCGHIVEISSKDIIKSQFEFKHTYETDPEMQRNWAIKLAKATIQEEWPECYDTIDWESIQIDLSEY